MAWITIYAFIIAIVITVPLAFNFIATEVYFKLRSEVLNKIFKHCQNSIYAGVEPKINFDDMYPIPDGSIWLSDCRLDHIIPKEKIKYLDEEVNKSVIK